MLLFFPIKSTEACVKMVHGCYVRNGTVSLNSPDVYWLPPVIGYVCPTIPGTCGQCPMLTILLCLLWCWCVERSHHTWCSWSTTVLVPALATDVQATHVTAVFQCKFSIIFLIFQMFCLKTEEIDWEYFRSFYVNFLKQKCSLFLDRRR